jgi:hypothetical protein
MHINRFSAFIGSHTFCQRKRKRYPGNEQEQRENHVVEMKSMPWHMIELFSAPFKNGPARQGSEAYENAFATHDPEHVEAT